MLKGLIGWLVKFGQVVLGTAVTFVVLNFAFLAGGYLTGHERMYMFDPLLGWRVLPNLNGVRMPFITYTDSHGFRILPNEPRDTSTCDVILLGDSFCFGSWVSAEQTLAGLLKLKHPTLRIANTAVPGYGTDQELLVLRRYAAMLKPQGTVILLTYINDFDDIRDRWEEVREKPWFRMDANNLVLERPDSWLNRFLWSGYVFSVTAYLTSLAFRLQPGIYGDDAYAARLYGALLEQMAIVARARGARFVVLYTSGPKARTSIGQRWAGVVSDAATRAGAKFFSLDDQAPLGQAMFAPDKIHWNAAGHLAVYSYISRRLDPQLPGYASAALTTGQ